MLTLIVGLGVLVIMAGLWYYMQSSSTSTSIPSAGPQITTQVVPIVTLPTLDTQSVPQSPTLPLPQTEIMPQQSQMTELGTQPVAIVGEPGESEPGASSLAIAPMVQPTTAGTTDFAYFEGPSATVADIHINGDFQDYTTSNIYSAEIANDTQQHQKLVIAGNATSGRRTVGIMDDLHTYGNQLIQGNVVLKGIINGAKAVMETITSDKVQTKVLNAGSASIDGPLTAGSLKVAQDGSMQTLNTLGDATIGGSLQATNVGGQSGVFKMLTSDGATLGTLTAPQATLQNVTLNTLTADGQVIIRGQLEAANVILTSMSADGNIALKGTLTAPIAVLGGTTTDTLKSGSAVVDGTLNAQNAVFQGAEIKGNTTIGGALKLTGMLTASNVTLADLTVSGGANFAKDVSITGKLTSKSAKFGILEATDLTLSNSLVFSGDGSIQGAGNLLVNSAKDLKLSSSSGHTYLQNQNGGPIDMHLSSQSTIRGDGGRLHLTSDELLYMLPKSGVVIGKEWGGTGDLTVQGNQAIGGNLNVGGSITSRNINSSAPGDSNWLRISREAGDDIYVGSDINSWGLSGYGGDDRPLGIYKEGSPNARFYSNRTEMVKPTVMKNTDPGNPVRLESDGGWNWLKIARNRGNDILFGGDDTNRGIWSEGNDPVGIYTGGSPNMQFYPDKTYVNKQIVLPPGQTIYGDGRMHLGGNELLYILNKDGVVIGREWGGNGRLQVQGDQTVGGHLSMTAGNAYNDFAVGKNLSTQSLTVGGDLSVGGTLNANTISSNTFNYTFYYTPIVTNGAQPWLNYVYVRGRKMGNAVELTGKISWDGAGDDGSSYPYILLPFAAAYDQWIPLTDTSQNLSHMFIGANTQAGYLVKKDGGHASPLKVLGNSGSIFVNCTYIAL